MAKRTSLSDRRADEARGIDSIIKPFAPPEAIGQLVEERPVQVTGEVAQNVSPAASTPEVVAVASKPALAKVTLYIRPDQVEAIEEIQLAQRRKTGKKPDKSDLVQEALDLLAERYRSL